MVVNKQSFYESINQDTIFDESFFKKVLGHSMYNKPFLEEVAVKLASIGRKSVVEQYNDWYAAWKAKHDQEMKKVAEWYRKECDKKYDRMIKEHQGEVVTRKSERADRFRFDGFPQII